MESRSFQLIYSAESEFIADERSKAWAVSQIGNVIQRTNPQPVRTYEDAFYARYWGPSLTSVGQAQTIEACGVIETSHHWINPKQYNWGNQYVDEYYVLLVTDLNTDERYEYRLQPFTNEIWLFTSQDVNRAVYPSATEDWWRLSNALDAYSQALQFRSTL